MNTENTDTNTSTRVNHPSYYNRLPIEVIEITKHFNFVLGNALKYILRSGFKPEEGMDIKLKEIEDLKKARWYLDYQIKELEQQYNKKITQ